MSPVPAHARIDATALVRDTRIGAYCDVGARTRLAESVLGDYSYVVEDCDIIYTAIARFVSIAAGVRINPGQHPAHRASQHHFQYRSGRYGLGEDDDAFFEGRRRQRVAIGPDAWIGHGSVIMGGVRVGTGAVIGAGAVVTRDVADYTVVAGVPARPLRERFPAAVQSALKRIAWWNWSHEQLRAALPDFRGLSAEAFCERYDGVSPAPESG